MAKETHTPGLESRVGPRGAIRAAVESEWSDHALVAYRHPYLELGITFGELRAFWNSRADLLEAAEALLDCHDLGLGTRQLRDRLKAAIAKAKGEQDA